MPEDIPAIFEVNYQAFAHDDGARLVAPFTVADDVFMILALEPGALDGIQGMVKYPEAFDVIGGYGLHKSKKGDSHS